MTGKPNLPAFPTSDQIYGGLTLRDYFAAQALTGLLSKGLSSPDHEVAFVAYRMADAMMAVREG